MSNTTFKAKHAMGRRIVAQALVAHDGFSARYDLNRLKGVFSRPAHKLVGQSYVDRVLVLDTAKGGVATAWMLHEMQSRNMAPSAIVFNTVNTILAQGAALGDVTMLAGFDIDITAQNQWAYMEHAKAQAGHEKVDFELLGTWYTMGITGRWPQVINIWEIPGGWDGWYGKVDRLNLKRRTNAHLDKWWDKAFTYRTGGFDRLCGGVHHTGHVGSRRGGVVGQ